MHDHLDEIRMSKDGNVREDKEVIELISSDDDKNVRSNTAIDEDSDSDIEFVGTKTNPDENYNPNESRKRKLESLESQIRFDTPYYKDNAPGYIPTWLDLIPPTYQSSIYGMGGGYQHQANRYKLSLLSLTEFTVSTMSNRYDKSNLSHFRGPLKKIVQRHGNGAKASFEIIPEQDNPDGGRWRIPLSCYHPFVSYLSYDPRNNVIPIPNEQLKIVSIGRELKDMGYPSVQDLVKYGVPEQLASSLAPYQRGGVGFTYQRIGRSLIADEMGLGKTIQGIASMACYGSEWPLLIFCPSGARYHWQHEILHWLGSDSAIYNDEHKVSTLKEFEDMNDELNEGSDTKETVSESNSEEKKEACYKKPTMKLLDKSEVYVLSHSKGKILPKGIRVVIASYGLGTNMIQNKRLRTGLFKCIIVDESHMLKNKNSKRTKLILPILMEAKRVVMLSGTPAFAKPVELYPQLSVLGADKGWWDNEDDFIAKYSKPIARTFDNDDDNSNDGFGSDDLFKLRGNNHFAELHTLLTSTVMIRRMKADILKSLPAKIRECIRLKVQDPSLQEKIFYLMKQLREGNGVLGKLSRKHRKELDSDLSFKPKSEKSLNHNFNQAGTKETREEEKESRKHILNLLFSLTAHSKLPIIVNMLKDWVKDETRGKLCIFAHHISVLDGIVELGGLCNAKGSKTKYIRIDGSTSPTSRHDQVTSFQNDPTVRVAVLGITAAGVAVTLTAAATVWFSELFWTPGVLIQAEDRCHRIGQQAAVNILYFIAKGTIDELLWKLVEKKFSDLGEFVEGKDNQKIVVHNIYDGEDDYKRQNDGHIQDVKREFENSSTNSPEVDDLLISELVDEMLIQNEINELGIEEQNTTTKASIAKNYYNGSDSGKNKTTQNERPHRSEGENGSIYLSDDENDDECIIDEKPHFSTFSKLIRDRRHFLKTRFPTNMQLPKLRFYEMLFSGPRYGINLFSFQKRVLVHSISEIRKNHSKPAIGDVLVSVNKTLIQWGQNFETVTLILKSALERPPVVLLFCENEELSTLVHYYKNEYEKIRLQTRDGIGTDQKKSEEKGKTEEGAIELVDEK